MGGKPFVAEAMLIPLCGCDMVLGVQWLSTLGLVKWDFKKLKMEFVYKGMVINLQGMSCHKLKVLNKPPTFKLLKEAARLCFIQVKELSDTSTEQQIGIKKVPNDKIDKQWPQLDKLKKDFAVVFEEPTELPPHRGIYDHKIPLEPHAIPVNIRPYRYPLK